MFPIYHTHFTFLCKTLSFPGRYSFHREVDQQTKDGMTAGGIWPAIVGTFYLMIGSALFAFPVGVMSGIYMNEYAPKGWIVRFIRMNGKEYPYHRQAQQTECTECNALRKMFPIYHTHFTFLCKTLSFPALLYIKV